MIPREFIIFKVEGNRVFPQCPEVGEFSMENKRKYKLYDITVEITRNCPLKCIICSTNAHPNASQFLPIEVLEKLIHDLETLKCKVINISGGEPFQYYEFEKLNSLIENKNININFYSCGNYLKPNGSLCSLPVEKLKLISKLKKKKLFSVYMD